MFPDDLVRLVLAFAGNHIPLSVYRTLGTGVMGRVSKLHEQFHFCFKQEWTPSQCNVLKWIPMGNYGYLWMYDVITNLTPQLKRRATNTRNAFGLVPIYPGNRQYPTSRVRFDPSYINDRYFR